MDFFCWYLRRMRIEIWLFNQLSQRWVGFFFCYSGFAGNTTADSVSMKSARNLHFHSLDIFQWLQMRCTEARLHRSLQGFFFFFAPAMERPDGDKTTGILPLWLFVEMRCKSSFASSLSLLSVCLCCVVNFCVQVSVCAYMRVCVCMTGAHHAALAQRHNVWQRVSQRSRLLFWVVFFVLFCFVFFPPHASKVFIAPQ